VDVDKYLLRELPKNGMGIWVPGTGVAGIVGMLLLVQYYRPGEDRYIPDRFCGMCHCYFMYYDLQCLRTSPRNAYVTH